MEWNRKMQMSCVAVMTLVLCIGTAFGMKYGTRKNATVFTSGMSLSQTAGEEWTRIQLGDSGNSGSDSTIMICQGGKYRFSGTLEEGQICVDTADGEEVVLCLAGVQISNSTEAAVYIKNAEQTTICLEEGTENILQSGEKADTEILENTASSENTENAANIENAENGEEIPSAKAAVYARDDLTITGEGILKVYGYLQNGIHTTNHLSVDSGIISVEAVNVGIKGKDSVTITGGDFSIISVGGGIKSNDTTSEEYGRISISGGTFLIESGGDGIQAETVLDISGGDFTITSGGGSEAAPDLSERAEEGFFGRPGGRNGGFMPQGGEGEKSSMPDESREMFSPLPDGDGEMNLPSPVERDEEMLHPSPNGEEEWNPPLASGEERMEHSSSGRAEKNQFPSDGQGDPGSFSLDEQDFSARSDHMEGESGVFHPGERDHREGMPGEQRGMMNPDMPDMGEGDQEETDEDAASSCKGLKSGISMEISGGTFTIDACDDALHSDGNILVSNGILSIKSGDDGVHADTELLITGGTVDIGTCYEGLEANQIMIGDGELRIISADDGINANGGMDRGWPGRGRQDTEEAKDVEEEMPNLCISGGTIQVNADGDGLDSNGNLMILGGTVIVDGPSDNGNGALDSGSESGGQCVVHGGLVLAIGSSGMAESFDSDSEQNFFSCRLPSGFQKGSVITITDTEGQALYTHTAVKEGSSIVFSCPKLAKGGRYILDVDGERQEIEI